MGRKEREGVSQLTPSFTQQTRTEHFLGAGVGTSSLIWGELIWKAPALPFGNRMKLTSPELLFLISKRHKS